MKTMEALGSEILELSNEDLSTILDVALHEFRRRRAEVNRKRIILFRPGQSVWFSGEGSLRLPKGTMGHVRKVNQRSVAVDFGSYGAAWRVDASLLEMGSASNDGAASSVPVR